LFVDDEILSAFKAAMRRQHRWSGLSRLKSEVGDRDKWKEIENTLFSYRYGQGELLLINTLGSSKRLVGLLLSVKRFFRA
jgi:hypothetical protein